MDVAPSSDAGSLRPWKRVLLIPPLVGFIAGFLVSYAYPAMYTSQSLVLVESQRLPQDLVQPTVSGDLSQRVAAMNQTILGRSRLAPMAVRLGLAKDESSADAVISRIQSSASIEPIAADPAGLARSQEPGSAPDDAPGFLLRYTASNPKEARDVCTELTSMLLAENIKSHEASIKETSDFLNFEVDDTREELKKLDAHSAESNSSNPQAGGKSSVQALERNAMRQSYIDLLAKLSKAQVDLKLAQDAESAELGEQWRLAGPASVPDDPDFPNRALFAAGGLVAGLLLGLGLALRLRFRRAYS